MLLKNRLLELEKSMGGPLLGLDTSSAIGSLCGLHAGRLEEISLDARVLPSESLVTAIATMWEKAGLQARQLKAVVVGLGPGSFTGLRVGLATAKGLALPHGLAMVGESSLKGAALSFAADYFTRDPACETLFVLPLLDARLGEFFCALYRVDKSLSVQTLIADGARSAQTLGLALLPYAAAPIQALGFSKEQVPAFAAMPIVQFHPQMNIRAAALLHLATPRLLAGDYDAIATLAPAYLRVSEAERQLSLKVDSGPKA